MEGRDLDLLAKHQESHTLTFPAILLLATQYGNGGNFNQITEQPILLK